MKKIALFALALSLTTVGIAAASPSNEESLNSSKSQIEKKNEASKSFLKGKGVSDEKIAKLQDNLNFVMNIIQSNNFGNEQAANFIEGITNPKLEELQSGKELPDGGHEINGIKEPGFGTKQNIQKAFATDELQTANSLTTQTNSLYGYSMDTGPHYIYTSNPGYHKAYMHVEFPQVYLANPNSTRAMEFFGFYHSTGGGGDAGLFTRDGHTWKLGMNIYPAINGQAWWEGGNTIDSTTNAEVLLVSWENNDTLFTSAFNKITGSQLSAISFYAPNHGFNINNTSTIVNNEHSFTFFQNQGDLTDGSYSLYGKHFNVLLSSNDSSVVNWDSSKTSWERKSGTSDEQKTIIYRSGTPFSDEVSIRFNLPRQ
jgi:hypothetical protein